MISLPRSALIPLLIAAVAPAAETSLAKQSPFMPAGAAAGPAVAQNESIEFAGISSVGKRTDLIIHDKTTKKSHWIAEGETKDGISVLRYDARREQVVLKVNGVEKTLQLRKGSGPVNAPFAVAPVPTGFNVAPPPVNAPAPVAPAVVAATPAEAAPAMTPAAPAAPAAAKPEVPGTPESQARAETEARMLVSDLLEIGMAQRKAYEEAQRRAAQGNSGQPAPPAPSADPAQPAKPNE